MKSHSETKNNQINKSENFGILNKIIASSKRKYTPPKPIFRKDNKSNKNITK